MLKYQDTSKDVERRAKLERSIDPSSEDHAYAREVIQNSNDKKYQEEFTSYLAMHTKEILIQHIDAVAANKRLLYLEQKGFWNWLRALPWATGIVPGLIIVVGSASILALARWVWLTLQALIS